MARKSSNDPFFLFKKRQLVSALFWGQGQIPGAVAFPATPPLCRHAPSLGSDNER